MIIEVRWDKER
jgi:hypothetical protein